MKQDKVTIHKVHEEATRKTVVVRVGYDDSLPDSIKGMGFRLTSDAGSMADRMRAAKTIKYVIEKHYGD